MPDKKSHKSKKQRHSENYKIKKPLSNKNELVVLERISTPPEDVKP